MLTHEYLLKILRYNPETGDWIWLIDKAIRCKKGTRAGSKNGGYTGGYIQIEIDGKKYKAHPLAWFYMTEEWPERQIDHKNTIRSDNRWENLRLSTQSQNGGNQNKPKNNTSGYKGVSWDKQRKKWRASIKKNYIQYHLGLFDCPIEAAKVYDKKAKEFFGEFALLNFP